MKRTWQAVGVTAGAAGLVLGGVGLAGATGDGSAPPQRRAASPSSQAIEVSKLAEPRTTFTPITPCRIVDTRASGKVGAAGRSFFVGGSENFAAQGGTAGGCGIPITATAVAANLVGVNATSSGFLKAFPAGSSAPSASVLNYGTAAVANELPLSVRPGGGTGLTVTASTPANLLIDVTGYYSTSIHVDVNADGSAFSASSAVTGVERTGVGSYTITVDRDVIACGASITMQTPNSYGTGVTNFGNGVSVTTWSSSDDGAWVAADEPFSVTVTC